MRQLDIIKRLGHDIEQSVRNCGIKQWVSRAERDKAAIAALQAVDAWWKASDTE